MSRLVGLCALFLAACIVLTPIAFGEERADADIDSIFQKLDVNKDGKLSKDEFLKMADRFRDKEKARSQLGQTYDKLDPNNRGLTRDQFRSFVATSLKKREEDGKKKAER
jgi:Ca2+-binding EF-hand superfamily protein